MELKNIVAFAVTTKPEEAKAFYGDALGFRFQADDGFALVFDARGTILRISKVPAFAPAQHTILGWEVDDIAGAVAHLQGKGVTFDRPPFLPPGETGVVCTFPTGDKVAWFKDPDGNVLSLSQHVKEAILSAAERARGAKDRAGAAPEPRVRARLRSS